MLSYNSSRENFSLKFDSLCEIYLEFKLLQGSVIFINLKFLITIFLFSHSHTIHRKLELGGYPELKNSNVIELLFWQYILNSNCSNRKQD
ncbi:hypothetical protein BpHYR1_006039 [Brachionus plicatilis]|uniref:Uncharacterized protein n=1 Tax=Brachionus plicatilis TaxID=10195 RepID=A0A3M7RBL5_BRAPC|nr:hypothetical protein BpHYR1_006039 [Brachionus plicatilis]